MVHSEAPEPAGDGQSLGDLVALAAKDVSQLIRYEIDLAKTELKGDVQRVGLAGAGRGRLRGCLVLVLLSIALAFGLVALGIWAWAAFLIVAGAYVLLAASGWDRLPEAEAAVRPERDAQDRDRRPGDAAPEARRPAARDRRD